MPTTQPTPGALWTPTDVMTLMGLISGVFLTALGILIVKVIDAIKSAKIAVIQAQAAAHQASENKGQADQLSKQVGGLQTQITAVAMQSTPPVSPVPPATFPGSNE